MESCVAQRSVRARSRKVGLSGGALTTQAPAGTTISNMDGDVRFSAPGGWSSGSVEWTLWDNSVSDTPSDAEVMAEIDAMIANGGNISYDATVFFDEQEFTAAPAWFEMAFVSNSDGGGYHFELASLALPTVAGTSLTTHVVIPLASVAGTDNDGFAEWTTTDTYRTFYFGLNTDNSGAVTTGVVHIDNVQFAANAVPEPGSLALLGLLGVGMVFRRRR